MNHYQAKTMIFRNLLIVMGLLVLGGCATAPPTQEMSDARQAIEAAEDAGAGKHASILLKTAKIALHDAREQLKRHHFYEARINAERAKSQATKARTVSLAIREASDAIAQAQAEGKRVANAKQLLSRAKAEAKDGHADNAIRIVNKLIEGLGRL
ncbi:MAG: DUF4398 domain-containing protein [Gammaproteobacteria bacterium]